MSDDKSLTDKVAECMIDDEWQEWLKANLSAEEWNQHIHSVRTLIKTHDKNVVEIVRAVDANNYISLGFYRVTVKVA